MKIIKGDLIKLAKTGEFDVIVRGCNCFHTMGSGIARTIKKEFPEAYAADLNTNHGDKRKLGLFSVAHHNVGKGFYIINGYTQYAYGSDKIYVDYDAVASVFGCVKSAFGSMRIGYPKIGAGLGGGDWEIISRLIDKELDGCDHTLVEFELNKNV